ncbi:MAG TPA: hypothetical protein VFH56_02210 [Acidimicrobiales bacterium]|nr:hypothetical protein [Acidimicrobiales bacterium]
MTAGLPDRDTDRERQVLGVMSDRPDDAHPGVQEPDQGVPPALAARPAPDDGEAVGYYDAVPPGYYVTEDPDYGEVLRPIPNDGEALDDRCGCRRGMGRRDPACHSYGLCGHTDSSPPTDALRQAVADELARHADQMAYGWDDDTVRLTCRCGHQRGICTKRELATNRDGRMRAYRLHVADAVIAVLGGLLDVHTPRVNGDAITTDKEHT